MKEIKRMFKFSLSDDLKKYLTLKAESNQITISQCIINLILEDKNKLQKENLLFNHVKNGVLDRLKEDIGDMELDELIKEEIDSLKQELKLNLR